MTAEQTVFIVDDDADARESVTALAESMGVRAQSFPSAENFLESYDGSQQGCLVTDVRMMGMDGLELQQQLSARGVEMPVIVITAYADVPLAVQAMSNGAVTLLQKPCREQELWESIRSALTADSCQRDSRLYKQEIRRRLAALDDSENQVLDRMIDGKMNKVIASELDISLRTVELRRQRIMKKLQAATFAQLVRMVIDAK